jgi:hypothetical protein
MGQHNIFQGFGWTDFQTPLGKERMIHLTFAHPSKAIEQALKCPPLMQNSALQIFSI